MAKNWCFWTVVLEKTLESPLDCKEIKPINLKGNHPWIFNGRTDTDAETPVLWPPDAKNWLVGKDPDAGIGWRWEEKGMTEEVMDGMTDSMDMNLSNLQELVMDKEALCAAVHRVEKSWTKLSDWTELSIIKNSCLFFFKQGFGIYSRKIPAQIYTRQFHYFTTRLFALDEIEEQTKCLSIGNG